MMTSLGYSPTDKQLEDMMAKVWVVLSVSLYSCNLVLQETRLSRSSSAS